MYNFWLNSNRYGKNEHTRIGRLLHKMLFPPSELNQREMETLVGNLQATADGRLAIVELCLAAVRYGHSLIIFHSVINGLGQHLTLAEIVKTFYSFEKTQLLGKSQTCE